MARVKGFLFTVGFMIFCAALLTLIVIIFSTTYQEDKRFSEIVALDRLQTLDNSIQHSIKEAFTSSAGINVTFRKEANSDFTDVMFNETIPNNVDAFNFNLDYIKLLVESEYNYTFLNVSHIKETLPLLVEPYNILYTHNFANNQIQIIPEDASPTSMLKGYRFVVTNLISTECQVQDIYFNGIFIVEIEASESDPFGNPNCIKNFVIDPDKNTSKENIKLWQKEVLSNLTKIKITPIQKFILNFVLRREVTQDAYSCEEFKKIFIRIM